MCWICDPIGETFKTVSHVVDVVSTDPLAQAAVAAGAVVATGPAGMGLWGNAAAATTAAEIGAASAASGAAALVPLEATAINSWGAVAPVVAEAAPAAGGSFSLASAASAGVSALGTAGKIAGGLNALGLVGQRTAGPDRFGGSIKSVVPVYGGGGGSMAASPRASQGVAAGAAGPVGGAQAGAPRESSLTLWASGLTIIALIYQFAKGN